MVGKKFGDENGRFFPECTQKTVTGGGGSVMLWGCISFGKLGTLILVNETKFSILYL